MKKRLIRYGSPLSVVIMPASVDAVFIDEEDKKHLVYWLRGGQVQNVYFENEETCRKDFEAVIGILSEE